MSEIASLNVKIDDKVIQAKVESIVLHQIAEALGNPADYIEKIVTASCRDRVDSNGRPTTSTYDSKPLINWVADKTIREFVTTCVQAWVAGNQSSIQKAIEANLKKNLPSLAASMSSSVLESAKHAYRMTVNLAIQQNERD